VFARPPAVVAVLAVMLCFAVRDLACGAVLNALVPALNQTRTVGLVTLPGAFVGAFFGGVSPSEAAGFQVTVLVALLCAETVAAVISPSCSARRALFLPRCLSDPHARF
jgi:ABC-type iron transport system FetAB permease component